MSISSLPEALRGALWFAWSRLSSASPFPPFLSIFIFSALLATASVVLCIFSRRHAVALLIAIWGASLLLAILSSR